MKTLLPALSLILAACTAQVTHPTKTIAEQKVDIDYCTQWANHKYWLDPVAALLNAYDCLEARGYKRTNQAVAQKVESAVKGADRPSSRPSQPCRVPCRGS
jgi:outer membrane biogenesis lipoprotein LolB